jgi:hypothetical protein
MSSKCSIQKYILRPVLEMIPARSLASNLSTSFWKELYNEMIYELEMILIEVPIGVANLSATLNGLMVSCETLT